MLDDNLSRRILIYASLSGALGVAIGAFGAHSLPGFLEGRGLDAELIAKRGQQFDIGARYHQLHSVALLALSAVPYGSPASRRWVARLFLLGIFFFSGSLYALALSNKTILGAITPIGGATWIVAWVLLLWVAMQSTQRCSDHG